MEKMITTQIGFFILIITFCKIHGSFRDFFLDDYWSPDRMVEREGYAVEIHNVTTEDGYILTVHRIPGNEEAQPILLMHGLQCNSAFWLFLGRGQSLAYLLADEGYDVWLGNVRGNTYGLNHVNLTSNDYEFWDFSYIEMGIYDLPATIDYIKSSTNKYPLYIGHSQGTTMSFILANEHPDIANSLKLYINLAPIAYKASIWDPLLRSLVPVMEIYAHILRSFIGIQTYFTPYWPLFLIKFVCAVLSIGNFSCLNVLPFGLGQETPELFNQTLLPSIINNFPAGTSMKNMILYAQTVHYKSFAKYDYGKTKNLEIYNSSTPPEYDLKKVTRPNAIFIADSDVFNHLPDLNKIYHLLPNIVDENLVNASGFSHLDFGWGTNAKDLVYDRVIELVNKYNNL